MANNFFLNQDPLLYQNPFTHHPNNDDMAKQLNDTMLQYKMLQQQNQQPIKDHIGELDSLSRSLNDEVVLLLDKNEEFQKLNIELKRIVEKELMDSIRWKVNSNDTAIKNMTRQTEIINKCINNVDDVQRKNLTEINDYMQNYSNITFDEYKKLKEKKTNKIKKNNKNTK